jgi:N4-gp56 family major capsid protein
MANTPSIDALRREVWAKELYRDVIANLYFTQNGMMGTDINNIVQLKEDLSKEQGDTVTIGLVAKMTGNGVSGDSELEGNEEALSSYYDQVAISQMRTAVRLTGKLDEQKNAYNYRTEAKAKLSIWMQEFIERQIFLKLGGVTNTTINDVNGTVVGANCAWSNTPDYIPTVDEAYTGSRYRYLNAGGVTTASLAATDLLTPQVIDKAKAKAQLASPKINPLRINGKDYYVMFVHPWQAYDLRQNATWSQAMREAEARGSENPIFTGSMGIWNNVIIHVHEYVPFLDVSVAGNSFYAAASGTDCAVDCFRALLCGQQAVAMVKCRNDNEWVEKSFDYENKWGVATSFLGGIQKTVFNYSTPVEYGVIAVDSAATAL